MRKRITSLLLTLVMLLSLVPAMGVTASAADGTADINNWDWFKSYLSSDVSRDLTLMKDINYTTDYDDDAIIIKKSQKLDLNGHKIRIDASKLAGFLNLITIRSGEFTLCDSSKGGGGAIEVEFARDYKGHSIIMISPDSTGAPAKFTMNGGTLTRVNPIDSSVYGNNGCISDNYFDPFEGGERPQITINGGTINCPYDWDRSQYSKNVQESMLSAAEYMPTALLLRYSNLTVNGGTVNGIVWTDKLTPKKEDTEPRVSLNGGVFNHPFAVTALPKNVTQVVIDGAQFNDGFYVGVSKIIYSFHAENDSPLLLKSGVFDSKGKNPKLAIYNATAKYFPNSAITVNERVYTSENIGSLVGTSYDDFYLQLNPKSPIKIIRDAWGVMESVTLDGKPIDYFKDWKGTVERMDNSTAHTITFKWKDLAQELKDAGYSYRAECDRYISGNKTPTTDTISATATEYSFTIPAGAAPKVYSFALHLNLKKGDNNIGIYSNEHIVKLVVNEAPVIIPDPTIEGNVYYTSGIVYGHSISTGTGNLPTDLDSGKLRYQWQRSTNGGDWENIDGATRGSYTPVAADVDENVRIRVVVTAEGYLGEIVGAPVKVSKAANDDTPTWPDVVAQKDGDAYKKFEITNYNPKQEYVYTTSPISGSEWPDGGTKITSATVEELDTGSTYYIYTRYKETDTHTAGSKIRSSSVLVDEINKLNRIILTDESGKVYSSYGSGNTIYIKKGESMTLTAKTNPDGANTWSDFTFKSQYDASAPFSVTAPTASVTSGSTIPSVTIYGNEAGTGTLAAEYPGYPAAQSYGTWRVHVYENVSDIGTGAEITVSPSFPDMTMYQGETMPLPEYTVDVYPEGALENYDLAWRIIKVGMGAAYSESDENITLENDEIKATKKHTGSENTRIALVAINKGNNYISSLSSFYVTVTEAPTVELTGVTVAPTKVNLDLNATYQLSAVKEPVNAAGSLTWTSDKPDVAAVSSTGEVTAKAQGTAIITVTCGTKSASCTVTVGHTHDTDAQPWVYMDPGTHIKTCTAGDDFKVEAHDFNAWTPNSDDTTHSRTCSKCKKSGEPANYTETANHNWQWVVDTAATPNAAGKQHEECVDCHAKRSENTEIPMLTSIMVENLTVAKPVKDAAAAMATTTDSTYYVANTEWMTKDGTPLAIGGKFQPGTVYTVKITLETAGAGVFSVKSTYNTIEGKTATVSPNLTGDNHADGVILTYTFDATEGTYVPTKPAITTVALPDGKVGDAYNQTLAATGTNPITWGIETGTLPDGLTLVGDTIKGTPSKAGDFKFTVKATNGGGSDTKELTIKVADAEAAKYHNVTLSGAGTGATGAGSHAAGTTVNIYAGTKSGYTFNGWTSDDVTVLSASSKNASFVMPDKDVTVKANWVYNGGGSSGGGYTYYTIKATAGVNGSISPTGNVSVREGRDQTFTITPNKGYAVAKVLIDSKNVGAVKSYTFENVKKNHTIEVVFMKASGNPQTGVFVDVPEGSYYEEAVNWAVEKGITTGTDATHFSPNGICTRAQAVTFLWRAFAE